MIRYNTNHYKHQQKRKKEKKLTEEELIDRIIFNSTYSEKLEFIRREVNDDLYLWNVLEAIRWWTDDGRFESWIVTKVCMNRSWKLSDEIVCDTYEDIKKREKTINYLRDLLSEKYSTRIENL